MNKMLKLKRPLREKMVQHIEKEDIVAVKKLMPHVDIVFPPSIFKMVANGHIKLVDILIKHYHLI